MTTHLESELQDKHPVCADLAALLCRGGLVVETPGGHDSVAVRSTIQLDGDMTAIIARPTLGHESVLVSHMAEMETRIQRVARLVKRTVWTAHAIIGSVVSVAWFFVLSDYPMFEDRLTTVAVWVGLSTSSVAVIEFLLRTSLIQEFLLSLAANGLSRFAIE